MSAAKGRSGGGSHAQRLVRALKRLQKRATPGDGGGNVTARCRNYNPVFGKESL